MDKRDRKYYKARAQTINLKEITSCEEDAEILRALRDNDPEIDTLSINDDTWDDACHFWVEEGDDLGWLGFFVGQSKSLQYLYIGHLPQDLPQDRGQVDALLRGIKHNRSIEILRISHGIGPGFGCLGSLLKNGNLNELEFYNHTIGPDDARGIADMLRQGSNNHNSLKKVDFDEISISDDSMAEVASALSAHVQLEELQMYLHNGIGRNTYVALGNALNGWNNPNLNKLFLSSTYLNEIGSDIDNEGLNALVAGMRNCHKLKHLSLETGALINAGGMSELAAGLASLNSLGSLNLYANTIGDDGARAIASSVIAGSLNSLKYLNLSGSTSISSAGLRSLSASLQSDSCSLTRLCLNKIRFGDDGAVALADGLKGNKKLNTLNFSGAGLTSVGWSAFSKLLCDTSSINNTFLSNHTLETIGEWKNRGTPDDVKQLLALNKGKHRRIKRQIIADVALLKILKSHPDFDVQPFCQWQLKLLPLVISWFERVGALVNDYKILKESAGAIQSRKQSTVYKFIRGMPLLTIDGYRIHNNAAMPAHSRKRKISQL